MILKELLSRETHIRYKVSHIGSGFRLDWCWSRGGSSRCRPFTWRWRCFISRFVVRKRSWWCDRCWLHKQQMRKWTRTVGLNWDTWIEQCLWRLFIKKQCCYRGYFQYYDSYVAVFFFIQWETHNAENLVTRCFFLLILNTRNVIFILMHLHVTLILVHDFFSPNILQINKDTRVIVV